MLTFKTLAETFTGDLVEIFNEDSVLLCTCPSGSAVITDLLANKEVTSWTVKKSNKLAIISVTIKTTVTSVDQSGTNSSSQTTEQTSTPTENQTS